MSDTTRREFLRNGLLGAASMWAGLRSPNLLAAVANSKPTVDRRPLGRIGTEVSILGLGLGTGLFGRPTPGSMNHEEYLRHALELGINYWDTSRSYRGSEETIGPVVKQNRDKIFLVSKGDQRDYDGFRRDIEASLKLLQTDHIDLYHIHDLRPTWDPDLSVIEKGALRAARKAKEEGTIRSFGVSGHTEAGILIEAIKRFDPDAVLTVFPCTRPDKGRYEDELLPLAVERKMGVIAMKTVRYAEGAKLKGTDLLKYALSLKGVSCAITGMSSIAQLDENKSIAINFQPMPKEQRAMIHEQARMALAGVPDPWDHAGYRDGAVV